MKKRFYILLPIYFSFFVGLGVYEITYPPFSANSVRIGNYEIQLYTMPSIPEVGKDIEKFRTNLKIYHDDLLHSYPSTDYNNGKMDTNYVFEEAGNHILRVDLLDLKNAATASYAFNVTVIPAYGTIFSYLIIAGIAGATGIITAIVIFQKKLKPKNRL